MEKKFSKGEWRISNSGAFIESENGVIAAVSLSTQENINNAKLIAAAPNMLDALLETDKDLCVLESTMSQIESTDPRAEGMAELVKKWRERNKLAINKATE